MEDVLCLSAHICANGCRLCSYVCQIHLSTWKCWKTHSSPVFDKSYYKNVLAHTFFKKKEKKRKKERNFIPYFKTAVNTFQTSLFHNNNNNKIQTNLEHKLSKKKNWKHITAAYISGLLSCDVNYLYYNSSTSAKFITI